VKPTKKKSPKQSATDYYVFAFSSTDGIENLHNAEDVESVGELTDDERDIFYKEFDRRCKGFPFVRLIPKQSISTDNGVESRMLRDKIEKLDAPETFSFGSRWAINIAIDIINEIRDDSSNVIQRKSQYRDSEAEARETRLEKVTEQLEQVAKKMAVTSSAISTTTELASTSTVNPKPFSESILAGTEHTKKNVLLTFESDGKTIRWEGGTVRLTKKPCKFVKALYNAKKQRMRINGIAAKVWGDPFTARNTIYVTLCNLRNELKQAKFPYEILSKKRKGDSYEEQNPITKKSRKIVFQTQVEGFMLQIKKLN
jgi:DNA-binding winged helix-turn-helix (wHTH) protein